jgi:hypothetical protein
LVSACRADPLPGPPPSAKSTDRGGSFSVPFRRERELV